MSGNPFGEFLALVLMLHKEEGPFSLEEVREVTDYILREGSGGVYIHESYDYMFSLSRVEEYPELFTKSVDQDGSVTFSRSGDLKPKLEFFFSSYAPGFSRYWSALVNNYINEAKTRKGTFGKRMKLKKIS